ncbi:MAG: hypothetical protein QXP84_05235 [Candidatus Korarchaeum sp.]
MRGGKTRAIIYILESGLKHYRPPSEGERVFYWDPKGKVIYPSGLDGFDEYVIIDSNIVTGRTVRKAIRDLKLPEERVIIRGNPKTEVARRIVDEPLSDPSPDPERVLIGIAGRAGSLKSFLANGLNMTHGIPVVQVGKVLKRAVELGSYGEVLHEKERENPFIVGELLYPILSAYEEKAVIVDGLKTRSTALFISYATRRPLFLFFVETDEELRRKCLRLRSDPDDAYAERRDELFEKGLEELKREAYAIIDWRDLNTLHPLCELLDILGYRTGEIAGFPNPFGSKRPILELYRRNVMRLLGTEVEEDLSGYIFHRNYERRLEEKGIILDQRRAEVLNLVASAFRYVDDILDENTIRDYRPAFWVENGFAKTMYIATLMTVRAYSICEELGLGEEFLRMFERVIDAVNYELLVEEGLAEFRSYEDWLRAAEREAAFREFLAVLAGRPEERGAFRLWGLKAQAKDDLMGAGKGGREETEGRLRRPLFRREWLARLEHKLNEALRTS